MTKNKKSSIYFDCLAVTDVKVTVFPNLPGAEHVKGVAEVVLNDQFIVRGLRILDCTTGLFVSYPVDPFYKGEDSRSVCFPMTRNLREHIENCVLEKYQEISSQ